ncbi:hypothetical protein EAY64_05620 [Aquitalea palustris]|uniref:Uncharacterized protein n=1 Tax=Aquitalea palustris TaxID=2480983 RepID=A0A454JL22_9NEIS|nr:hypothetical protein [Aquitalea palustris]RMD00076.1 hypothetical protein EAY64_05620 [Aquitalea palustris]
MHKLIGWLLHVLKLGALLVLLLCWGGNTPHYLISNWVGAHFPWSSSHQRVDVWAGLLVEGLLIHLLMAIITVPVLLLIYRRHAAKVALALSLVFITRAMAEVPLSAPSHILFLCYLSSANLIMMVGLACLMIKFLNVRDCRAK